MAGGIVATSAGTGEINALIHSGSWYSNSRLIKLNAWILLLLITSSTNGYDGASFPFDERAPASSFFPLNSPMLTFSLSLSL